MLVAEKQFGITEISFSVYYKEVRNTNKYVNIITYCFMDFIHGYMVRDHECLYHA